MRAAPPATASMVADDSHRSERLSPRPGSALEADTGSDRWRHPLHHRKWGSAHGYAGHALGDFSGELEAGLLHPKPPFADGPGVSDSGASFGPRAHYAGSQSCQKCHSRDLRALEEDADGERRARSARASRRDHSRPRTTNNVAKFTKDQVAFVYGSIGSNAISPRSAMTTIPLPAQWDIGNKKWLQVSRPGYGRRLVDRILSVGQYAASDRPYLRWLPLSRAMTFIPRQVAEWNVGCERCHGPGSEHVAHPTRTNILNPSQMDDVACERHLHRVPLAGPAAHPADRGQSLRLAGWLSSRPAPCRTTGSWKITRWDRPTFYSLRGRNRAQEPDAGQRLCSERHVQARCDLRLLP